MSLVIIDLYAIIFSIVTTWKGVLFMFEDEKKEKEVARYKNEVNSIPMRNWNKEEMDFFFAVLTRMRDEGTTLIFMNKHELADLARYTISSNQRYHDLMEKLSDKVSKLQYWRKTSNSILTMPLFTYFEAKWTDDLTEMTIEIEVNKRFEHILNDWNEGNWTQFMLKEFTEIKSTYSKTLFRLLKQWRTKGVREFTLEEFKQLMDVPKSYSAGMINKRIITNSVRDLKPYFKNLKVKILKSNAHGTPIIGFKFTWTPEKTSQWDDKKFKKRERKIENLPEWATDPVKNDDKLSEEAQEEVRKNLERFKKLKEE